MSPFKAFWRAWSQRDQLGDQHHDRELAQFLPAALEIQATPPNPLARWLSWALMAMVTIGVVWACFGQVNIVATAEGKVIPSSRVKKIQPLEKAVVKNILVKEGQYVQQGNPLIELDNTLSKADQTRIANELQTIRHQLQVSQALTELLAQPKTVQDAFKYSDIGNGIDQPVYQQLFWQQWQHYRSQVLTLQNRLKKTKAEQRATGEQIYKLEQTLPIVEQRVQKIKKLLQNNYASEDNYLTLEQERIEQQQNLRAEQQRFHQLQAASEEAAQEIKTVAAQTQAQYLTERATYQSQIATLEAELTKAQDRNAKQILYAPVSGSIQELAVNTIGGVVTEAQQLMLIVPDEEQLEVEVFLPNKDIGFVNEGMMAEIKIHTFPFTKYGVIDAEVMTVSDDATLDEQQGLIYRMRLLMKQNTIDVDGKTINLIPGMAVTAEMQTGYRRIIEFFLAPLLRYQQEGLRER